MSCRLWLAACAVLLLAPGFALASPAGDTAASSVLLVVNAEVPGSADLADAYRARHGVPPEQAVTLTVDPAAVVSRADYERLIERPIAGWLMTHEALDRIRFIVLAPGVPLRIAGSIGRNGTAASVDSELSLLYRRLAQGDAPIVGRVDNPYFHSGALGDTPRPFDRRRFDIYLVTRLDGATVASAFGLLSRGGERPSSWLFAVDGRAPSRSGAERRWLREVPARLASVGPQVSVVLDESDATLQPSGPVAGYFGWGSNDTGTRRPPVPFGPGAIAASFMSADARTLEPPPDGWTVGRWEDPASFYAGSPEALATDWIDAGLTGLAANVAEPYLDAAVRPATLFEAWARGYTLAESYYLATPFLSWQTVVFGDPLARAADPGWPEPDDPGLDEVSGLPAMFLERRAAAIAANESALSVSGARSWIQAQRALAQGRADEGRQQLEALTIGSPKFVPAHILLAQHYDALARHDLARRRYELALGLEPQNVVALNNLAYLLAVHEGDVAAALPLVDRLMRLAPQSPVVLDTVGWVWHLAGRSADAVNALRRATDGAPDLCEAWEHLAAALEAEARRDEAAEAHAKAEACRAAAAADPPGR